jgi:YtcA family
MKSGKPMQQLRRALALLRTFVSAGLLGGCAAAPSISVAGAYFPAWLVCALVGVLGAIVARMVIAGAGLAQTLPLQLLVCLSIGVVCAAAAWAGWVVV